VDLNKFEMLAPVPFVLIAGVTGGLLQAIAEVTQHHTPITIGLRLRMFAFALTVWLAGVRRRRYSVWGIALQLSLASILANLIALSIIISIVVPAEAHLQWGDIAVNAVSAQFGLGLLWFVAAAGLVAMGRFLPGSGRMAPIDHLNVNSHVNSHVNSRDDG
jgi:hypothetical protein